MLTIRNIAALAAVLGSIDAVIAQQGAYAQCELFTLTDEGDVSTDIRKVVVLLGQEALLVFRDTPVPIPSKLSPYFK